MSEANSATDQNRQRVLDSIQMTDGGNAAADEFVRGSLRLNGFSLDGRSPEDARAAAEARNARYWARFIAPPDGPSPGLVGWPLVVSTPYRLEDTDGKFVGWSNGVGRAEVAADPIGDAVVANLTPLVGRVLTEADVEQLAVNIRNAVGLAISLLGAKWSHLAG